MSKSILLLIAAIMLALGASPVLAQDREFVGVTTVATPANVGILAMHKMCAAQFKGGRVCSSADILANGGVDVPDFFGPLVWLQPTLVAGDSTLFRLDASGVDAMGSLSCFNWSVNNANVAGLVLSPSRITASSCDNIYPVACCSDLKK